jgi:hypothetical protein
MARLGPGEPRVLDVFVYDDGTWLRFKTDADFHPDDLARGEGFGWGWERADACIPDLRDPATAGLLPMLVREVLGSEHIVAQWNGFLGRTWDPDVDDPDNDRDAVARDNLRQWQIREQVAGGRVLGAGATRIDAWLAAWETAR